MRASENHSFYTFYAISIVKKPFYMALHDMCLIKTVVS